MKNAIEYLNKNKWLYAHMIELLQRGEATLLAFDSDGAVIKQEGSLTNFCLTSDQPLFGKYADLVRSNLCCIYDVKDISDIQSHYPEARRVPCRQLVYTKKEPPVFSTDAEIRLLDQSWAQFIFDTYGNPHKSVENITKLINRKFMFGIFVGGEIAGYCGRHIDGAMGLLEVLPRFRRQGLGRIMEQFIIGEVLKEGRTPFGHVVFGNEVSMRLQQATEGLLILPETVMFQSFKA